MNSPSANRKPVVLSSTIELQPSHPKVFREPRAHGASTRAASDSMIRMAPVLIACLVLMQHGLAAGTGTPLSGVRWSDCLRQSTSWYKSDEARRIAGTVMLFQRDSGGWPKGIEMTREPSVDEKAALESSARELRATIDNGATTTEIRFLAKVFAATGDSSLRKSLEKGIRYLLAAQYANGGWPQFFPLTKGYSRHITFNDNAMVNVLNLLMDIADGKDEMQFTGPAMRSDAAKAVQKGVECILACQVRRDGVFTAWCAQHDESTYAPAPARAFELVSLSGSETVGIVRFLMRIPKPGPQIITAVQSAVAWLDRVRLRGLSIQKVDDPSAEGGKNDVVVADADAPPLWARFYDIDSDLPFVADRDTVKRYALADLSSERRNNYGWFGDWPQTLLTRHYPKWQSRWAKDANVLEPLRRDSLPGLGKLVALDMYFNNEWRDRKDGGRERYHYTWDDTTNSGFSQLGAIIGELGARRCAIAWAPTLETLGACDVYIIVDPDLPKESPDPHMMDSLSVHRIREWVQAGGVLVMMANDAGNAEFDHFNTLAREFGITFNGDSYHGVVGNEFETGATSPLPAHDAFAGVRKIFTKEVSSLTLVSPAKAILAEGETVLMAESRAGKGLVFAVGDPWLYNEYMDHRRLPADFDNDRAAGALFRWLLAKAR